jgi:hypothetical protein
MMLKTYRYVFVLTRLVEPERDDYTLPDATPEPDVYTDENSLPSTVSGVTIRKAKESPTRPVWSPASAAFLTYSPIQGK